MGTEGAPGPAPEVPENAPETNDQNELEIEREKHRRRAEKFGVDYVEPGDRRDLRHIARKERFQRQGFATGVDPFSQEEIAKRAQRAARFGTQDQGLTWKPAVPDEDEEKRAARAARFGTEYKHPEPPLMDVDLLEIRKEPSLTAALRREGIYVYGVDLMSTGDLMRLFGDYGPTYVEWINDSSCVVTFADGGTAKRAVAGMGAALPPEAGSELQGLDSTDPENMEYMWHQTHEPVQAAGGNPLLMRISTVDDVKPQGRVQSRRLWQQKAGETQRKPRQRKRARFDNDEDMAEAATYGDEGRLEQQEVAVAEEPRKRVFIPGPAANIFAKAIGDIAPQQYGTGLFNDDDPNSNQPPVRDALSYADL